MLGIISDFKNLYVADYFEDNNMIVKIVFSRSTNFVVGTNIIYPFARDLETGTSVLVSSNNHVKRLNYYVNCFGFPRKNIIALEKEKQQLVLSKVKTLKKMRKI